MLLPLRSLLDSISAVATADFHLVSVESFSASANGTKIRPPQYVGGYRSWSRRDATALASFGRIVVSVLEATAFGGSTEADPRFDTSTSPPPTVNTTVDTKWPCASIGWRGVKSASVTCTCLARAIGPISVGYVARDPERLKIAHDKVVRTRPRDRSTCD
jgi:hypothetical protein